MFLFVVHDKMTVPRILKMYKAKEPVSMLTAHDYPSGQFADAVGVDIVLVGDSLAMVALGYASTVDVTMDEMLHHCRAVARGVQRALRVGDMPFGSYMSEEAALHNAVRFLKEGHMECVKLESGRDELGLMKRLVRAGIPVMGHVGLTPQKYHLYGGFPMQGRTAARVR
jgi:3-methyl-2-oxobutanoate hydroxymethyltransferase